MTTYILPLLLAAVSGGLALLLVFVLRGRIAAEANAAAIQMEKNRLDAELATERERSARMGVELENLRTAELELHVQLAQATTEKTRLDTEQASERERSAKVATELEEMRALAASLNVQLAQTKAEQEEREKSFQERLAYAASVEERAKSKFEELAAKLLEEKGKEFGARQLGNLELLLKPFRQELTNFRSRIDVVHTEDAKHRSELLEQIREMQRTSNKVSEEANNLATAIKGDRKRQGNWGELIVERIFESSGLMPGREYERQVSMIAENGRRLQPDFVVKLPQNRSVIVDSKVSLSAYDRFCAAETEEERRVALAEHRKAVQNHINELRAKQYQNLLSSNNLDFVIMCVPIEPAYLLALAPDYEMLYDNGSCAVVLTGPSTLLVTLKLIQQIWRREREKQNAVKIAAEAGKLYDNFSMLLDDLCDLEKAIRSASAGYEKIVKRIASGNGNINRRLQTIQELGAKVSRQHSAKAHSLLEEYSDDPAEIEEEENHDDDEQKLLSSAIPELPDRREAEKN